MDPLDVTRRRTYEVVRFPESRATEALYHLDFARTFLTMTCPDVVAVRHSDAETRHAAPSVPDLLLDASDNALALETILERHGESIRSVCPGYYFHLRAKAGIYCLMAGWRGRGVRHLAVCLRAGSLPAEAWVGGIIGLCSPAWLAGALRSRRIRMLGSRRKRRAAARGDAAA
jgi:hypothetical protein